MMNKTSSCCQIIKTCGAPLELQKVAMYLNEEWKADKCEVAIIDAKPDAIILEAIDGERNEIRVKIYIKDGEPRMAVTLMN